jgi:hemerythrin-like domain-containing protein
MGYDIMNRRRFIGSLLIAGTNVIIPGYAKSNPAEKDKGEGSSEEQMVTPGEDLMREHGVIERILLIYEEVQRRIRAGELLPVRELHDSSQIVHSFVEDYHEKLEENYLFPRFEKANQLADLVHKLKTQHDAGRRITTEMLNMPSAATPASNSRLDTLITQFIRMYRPHYAREDTVLFPAFPAIVGEKEYLELGEAFEDQEHKLFGKSGFTGIVEKVAVIEKNLGIYELAQFTPKL